MHLKQKIRYRGYEGYVCGVQKWALESHMEVVDIRYRNYRGEWQTRLGCPVNDLQPIDEEAMMPPPCYVLPIYGANND